MSDSNLVVPVRQRLADFHVTLFCPVGVPEEQLERLCDALDALDFRSKIQ
jgi:2'-5' RNA ligase